MLKTIYIFILLSVVTIGCRREKTYYRETLNNVEILIDKNHIDSAMVCLSRLDSVIGQAPKEEQILHSLLKVKANDKQYNKHTSDSLMKEVVRFYESYGDNERLMEAYFYLGSVYRDMKDAPRAISAFQNAAEAGKDSKRYDVLGRVYGQTGTLLAYQRMYDEALDMYKKSYSNYLKQNEDKNITVSLRNIARMYQSVDKPDSALYYYETAHDMGLKLKDNLIKYDILSEVGCFYIDIDKLDLAKDILLEVLAKEKRRMRHSVWHEYIKRNFRKTLPYTILIKP